MSEIKDSASKIGQLYPILLDAHGNIIDGHHRIEANKNWMKIKLENVRTEEDILLCKLISNMCRRNISPQEKGQLLEKLGNLYLNQGHEKIAQKIAEKTGMSYRWVMKYIPDYMKARPGSGGPSISHNLHLNQSSNSEEFSEKSVARHATDLEKSASLLLSRRPQKRVAEVKRFSNTGFVQILIDKEFYSNFETLSRNLGISSITLINNAFFFVVKELEELSRKGFKPFPQIVENGIVS